MTPSLEPDRRWFAAMVEIAAADSRRPLGHALGVAGGDLERLLSRFLPQRPELRARVGECPDPGPEALEEPDLRALLLECRAGRCDEVEGWLAAIIARRSQEANHLWQDLGLASRSELGLMLRHHFPELVRRNHRDMKWKKFFYRQLCQQAEILICKSPSCAVCSDHAQCFEAPEPDAALLAAPPTPAAGLTTQTH